MRYCIWSNTDEDDPWYIDAEDMGEAAIAALDDLGYSVIETDDEEEQEELPFGFEELDE